jgi:hypothetical protein
MKADDNTITFLHFAKPIDQPNNKLIFIGDGVRGKFCAEDQPSQGKTGYVHFHSLVAEPGQAHNEMAKMGHGGKPGAAGFWLRHIAVDEFDIDGSALHAGCSDELHAHAATKVREVSCQNRGLNPLLVHGQLSDLSLWSPLLKGVIGARKERRFFRRPGLSYRSPGWRTNCHGLAA